MHGYNEHFCIKNILDLHSSSHFILWKVQEWAGSFLLVMWKSCIVICFGGMNDRMILSVFPQQIISKLSSWQQKPFNFAQDSVGLTFEPHRWQFSVVTYWTKDHGFKWLRSLGEVSDRESDNEEYWNIATQITEKYNRNSLREWQQTNS